MPLLKIKREGDIRQVLVAAEGISDLATVILSPGARQVTMGATGSEHLAAGVARGGVSSGALIWVQTHGLVSGVKVATSAVQAGDRLAIRTSGKVTPFNTITTSGLVSGIQVASGIISGYASINAFNTGRVLGRALTSGGSGAAIQAIITLE